MELRRRVRVLREGIIRASVWERTHEGSHLFPERLSCSVCPDSSGVRTRAYAYAHAHSMRIVPDNGGCSTVFSVMLDASRRRDASFNSFHLHFLLYSVICFPVKESNVHKRHWQNEMPLCYFRNAIHMNYVFRDIDQLTAT